MKLDVGDRPFVCPDGFDHFAFVQILTQNDVYPKSNNSRFISTNQKTVLPLKVHDGFFVRANESFADSLRAKIPHDNWGIIGPTDSDSIIS